MRGVLGVLVVCAFLLAAGRPAAAQTQLQGFHSAWAGQDPWPVISFGTTTTYSLRFKNIGTETWQRGVPGRQVNLGIVNDSFAYTGLAEGWMSGNRVATTVEEKVAPGATGTFTFTLRAPMTTGSYDIPLRPVVDGVAWLEHQGVFVRVVSDLGWHSKWVSQSANPSIAPGTTSDALTITLRNSGIRTWTKGVAGQQAAIGIRNDDRTWSSLAVDWPDTDRPAIQNEATVAPGQNGTFTFRLRAPHTPSTYVLSLRPVIDGTAWLDDEGIFVSLTVSNGTRPVLDTEIVQSDLRSASDVAFAPDGRMFVTEKVGNLLVYQSAESGAAQVANDAITGVHSSGDAGLMSVELDPSFATNAYLYVCASRDDEGQWRNQVLRYKVFGNAIVFDSFVIRRGMLASPSHDGCRIRFGPDGKLWVTMGDGGSSKTAQDPTSLNGKILRVERDGRVPADNPILGGAATRTAVYAIGMADPQGLSFEPDTGRPFEVERSESRDEINMLTAGGNYGYPTYQGNAGKLGYLDPAWSSNSLIAAAGGEFLAGSAWGSWQGSIIVATTKTQLLRFELFDTSARMADVVINNQYGRLRTPRLAPDGALYITTDNGTLDRIIRITAAQP